MNKVLLCFFSFFSISAFAQSDLIITGTFDGPLTGGHPKGVEIYVANDVADLSIYGIGSANNGGGSDGQEYTFPAESATAGSFIYVVAETPGFMDFFGFAANYEGGAAVSINGDDAIELFMNGNVVDVFGDINMDASMTAWDHLDGWAYRQSATGPDGTTFDVNNWTFSGVDAFEGFSSNREASNPFPIGTYSRNPNSDLTANPDFITTDVNIAATINLTDNDNLPNGFDMIEIADAPTNGTAAVDANGNVIYAPNIDYCGGDGFTYTVCWMGDCVTGGVRIEVVCPILYTPSSIGGVTMVDANGLPTAVDSAVALTGVVHSINFRPNGLQFALIDDNNDGITVFSNSDPLNYTVAMGDNITVHGAIGSFRGSLQVYADEVVLNSSGNTLFDPTVVTALNEDSESQLVVLENVSLVDVSQWSNSGSGFNVDVTDGTNTYAMRIVDATNIFGTAAPTGSFDLIGIGGQFDFDEPFLDGYQLFPRSLEDIVTVLNTEDVRLSSSVVISPNPVSDILTIKGLKNFERITVINSVGQAIGIFNQNTIEVSHLPSGLYFLQIENKGERMVSSFVKE